MEIFSFRDFSLNIRKSEISRKGQVLELEPQVYCILELLITCHGEIVSRDDIIDKVWDGRPMSNNVIDSRIRAARAALGDTGKRQRYINVSKSKSLGSSGKVMKLAGAVVSGLLGLYMITQVTKSVDSNASVGTDAIVNEDTYKLASSDEINVQQ